MLFAAYQEESIFMLLILFDPKSIMFICSTDRTCLKNQGKQKNVRDSEEFELNGSRDIEDRLH